MTAALEEPQDEGKAGGTGTDYWSPLIFQHPNLDVSWMSHGLCRGSDPEAWFPASGSRGTGAKRVCMQCPVRTECLDYSVEANERFGIWGGVGEQERRRMMRERKNAQTLEG